MNKILGDIPTIEVPSRAKMKDEFHKIIQEFKKIWERVK